MSEFRVSCSSKLLFRWAFEHLVGTSTILSMTISSKLRRNVVLDIIIFVYILENRELLCKNALSLTLSSLSLHTFCQLVSQSKCGSRCVISQESVVTGSRSEFYWHELRTAENCKSGRSRKIHLNLGSTTSAAYRAAFFHRSVNSVFY